MNNKKHHKYKKTLQDDYIQYLLRLFENEDKRQNVIEGKISQLINQSGLIISIIAFIIPLLYDKLNTLNICFKLLIGVVFIITISLIGFSIYFSSRILRINKFNYADCSPSTVKKEFDKDREFKDEYIDDLIYSLGKNKGVNDSKGTILMKSNRLFVYGLYGVVIQAIILIIAYYFI